MIDAITKLTMIELVVSFSVFLVCVLFCLFWLAGIGTGKRDK